MKAHASVTLSYHGLKLSCPQAGLSEDRPLSDKDVKLLTACS